MATKKSTYTPPTTFDAQLAEIDQMLASGYRVRPPREAEVDLDEPKERGMLRGIADTGLEVMSGAAKGVKFMTDVAGANNAASRGLDAVSTFAKDLQSAQAKGEDQRMGEIMKAAEDQGVWEQVKAALSAAGEAPIRQSLGAIGTALPMIAASMVPGMREAAWGTRMGALAGMGAAQGAGVVKSSIYDAVYERAKQEGRTEEEARAMAEQQQSYSENPGLIAGGAALGGGAAATGFAPAVLRSMGGAGAKAATGASAPGLMRELGMGVAKEVPLEAVQGGQEQYAGNMGQDRAGFETPWQRGVAGASTLEATLSAPGGLAGGAMDYAGAKKAPMPGDIIRDTEKVPESGPMTRAANTATEVKAQQADAEALRLGFSPLAGTPVVFADGSVALGSEAEQAKRDQLAMEGNIEREAAKRAPRTAGDAYNLLAEAKERGLDYTVALHPAGGGFLVVPKQWVTPEAQEAAAGQLMETIGRMRQADAAPVQRAPRTGTTAQELDLSSDPVTNYVDDLRQVNTPAAKLFVRDFDTGSITADDVRQRMDAERTKTPDERLAAAAAEGLRMNPKGDPFKTLMAAQREAKKNPGEVIEVQGGYAIRPQQEQANDPIETTAGPTDAGSSSEVPPAGDAAQGALNEQDEQQAAWQQFPAETGTLNIPRAEMPQVKTEHRGPMVNFLGARGVTAEQVEVDPADLKPTQAEFSQAKVQEAADRDTDRSILISSDGHIIDGHHQALAKLQNGQPVRAIKLGATAQELIPLVREFPSSTVDEATNVQNAPSQPTRAEAQAAPVEAPAPTGSDAAAAAGVPDAGRAGDVQADGVKPFSTGSFDSWRRQGMNRGTVKGWTIFQDPLDNTYRLARKGVKERNQAGGGYVDGEIVAQSFASVDEAKTWASSDLSKNQPKIDTSAEPVQETAKSEPVAPASSSFDPTGWTEKPSKNTPVGINRYTQPDSGGGVRSVATKDGAVIKDMTKTLYDVLEDNVGSAQVRVERDNLTGKVTAQVIVDGHGVGTPTSIHQMLDIGRSLDEAIRGVFTLDEQPIVLSKDQSTSRVAPVQETAKSEQVKPGDGLAGYKLPSGRMGDDWARAQSPDFEPDPRQQLVMDAVAKALDAGKFYNRDVDEFVAQELKVGPEVRSVKTSNTEGGDFGYDVYHARRAVEAQRANAKSREIADALVLKPGDKIGTIIPNDFKRITGLVVESLNETGLIAKVSGKRGTATISGHMGVDAIKAGIERAKEKGSRKDGFDDFVAQRQQAVLPKETAIARRNRLIAEREAAAQPKTENPAEAKQDATPASQAQTAQDFIPAPDGGLDYGEITPEMSRAMRRQAGKIRLTRGVQNADGTGHGLVHIEANHGKQIRALGFGSIEEFVAHVAGEIQQVWQVPGNSQLLVTTKNGRKDVMFIRLEIAKEGDFYRVNSAFPVRQPDYEAQRDMKKIWDGSEPTSAVTGQRPAFATAAIAAPDSESSQGSSNARGQDASVPPGATDAQAAEVGKSPAKIDDSGEKIGGARKDRWKERGLNLDDLDSMTEAEGAELATKANVWKPDYTALADAAEPVTAAMVKVIYDRLAAKPAKNTPEGRRQYVQMMRIVRDVYAGAKGPEAVRNAYLEIRQRAGLNAMDPQAKAVGRALLFSVYKGRSDPFTMDYTDLSKAKKMAEDGFPAKGEPWKTRLVVGRREGGAGTTARGVAMYTELSAEVGTPLTAEQIEAGFFRVMDKKNKTVAFATSKEDAEAAAKTVYERDMKGGKDGKPDPERPHLDEMKRENLPKRIDRDATSEDFIKDLGFRGIEFGNWSAQDERQRILNMAYDGLMDLAEIMGVPPKAMSLNGTLGMAFGARGGGRFAAHYEPGKLVINMTKIRGGGSMAHEWAHAMDHYFGELNKADAYTTKARGASGWMVEDQYKGLPRSRMEQIDGKWKSVNKMRLDNLRPELAAAFDGVMQALFQKQINKAEMVRSQELGLERTEAMARMEPDAEMKAMYQRMAKNEREALEELRKDPEDKMYDSRGRSDFAKEAQALSGKSATGYWTRPTEMFARSFESWVFDRVTAMGARSDYLVHGVEAERFAGGDYKGNPYPTGVERARINAAFDKLADTIQTKEDDAGNVAMFSRSQGATSQAVAKWQDSMRSAATNPQAKEPSMETPMVLRMIGAKAARLVLPRTYLKAILAKHPDVPAVVFERLPEMLADPLFIIPHKDGGLRVFVDAQTGKGEPIFVGVEVGQDGRIHTVSPLHNWGGKTGGELLKSALSAAMARPGKIYARNKEALVKTKASAEAAPAILALHRDSNSESSVITRADVVKRIEAPGSAPGYSRTQPATGLTQKTTQGVVDAISARWANAPEIVVVSDMQDAAIPERVRQEDAKQRSQGATGEPEGFYYSGKVYVVASALNKPADVVRVLFHETLGHAGLRGVFGESLTPILKQLAALRRADVAAKAKEYGLDMNNEADRLQAAEEVLAVLAQTRPELGYVQRAIAAIRAFLRKNVPGFQQMALTDADIIANYILPARRFVEGGGSGPRGGLPAFSRPDDAALSALRQADDLFAMPKSGKKTIAEITREHDPEIKVKEVKIPGNETFFNLTMADGTTARITVRKSGPNSVYDASVDADNNSSFEAGRPGENPEDVDPYAEDVWIDASQLKPGQNGIRVYSIASTFAHNTGRIFIGDPNGLSDEAMRRRSENMLSSALKFGTTKHLAPHPRQVKGGVGVPALKWVYGDDVGNIERLIDLNLRALDNADPDAKQLAYDPETGAFSDARTGRPLTRAQLAAAATDPRGRSGASAVSQAGWRTVARGAVFRALLGRGGAQGDGAGRAGGGGRVLDGLVRQREKLASTSQNQRVFYSRSQGAGDSLNTGEGPRFSRSAGIQKTLIDAVPQGVIERLSDMTTSQRGFNRWWHRTVGTQLHKAKTNKQFAPVYYAVQDFMKDVSRMATLAADQAPDLLPQVDNLSDVKKLLPQMGIAGNRQRKAELKAASEALFDGTLRYTRDEDGKAVLAKDDDAKGLVWTTDELKARGMSDKAIAMYQQARQAINQSLDNLLAADVYRMMTAAKPEALAETKPDYDALMDRVRKAAASDNPGAAVSEVSKALAEQRNRAKARIESLKTGSNGRLDAAVASEMKRQSEEFNGIEKLIERVSDKVERIDDLKASGYAPLMRFGQYTLDALDASGNRVYFGMYENQMAANQAARKFKADGLTVRQGVQSQKEFELLKGVSPETAMLFAEMMGTEKNEAMQSWLQNAVAQQSALKRHIRRKGVEGFENDASRVVAAFLTSNSRAASRALHGLRIQESVENVRDGDVKDEAIDLAEYVNNPKEEAQALRSLLFINYIGGSVASALVNLTQTVVQTFPYLSQYGGPMKSGKRIGAAMKMALGKITDADLAAAVARAEDDGVIKPQEVFQLQAEASRTMGSDLRIRAGLTAWGSFFQLAEVFNRRVAFIAAYQTAKEQGIADPFAFAENAVDETQGVFNKGNRPDWARGAVGATLFTFKTFTVQYVEFLKRLPPKEKALALGVLILLSGMRGLPFAGDAEDLIDTVAQQLGYNFTSKDQMDRFLVSTLGGDFAGFLQHGMSTIPGMPFDVSARLGMADLLPGTGLLKPSETRKEDQVLEAFGVAGSFVRDAISKTWTPNSLTELSNTAWAPIAIRNLAKGLDMYDREIYTDTRGRKVMDVGGVDALMKGIGLQPNDVASESRKVSSQYEKRALFTKVKGDISEQIALGMFEQDQAKVKAAREKLAKWNERNPEAAIVINSQAIRRRVTEMRKDRAERFLKSTPKELRQQTQEALQ